MSFQLPARRARVSRRLYGMGNIVDDIIQQDPTLSQWLNKHDVDVQGDLQCLADANRAVAAMDQNRNDLVKNWKPSGLYTTQQIDAIINSTFQMLKSAIATVDKAMSEPLAQGDRDALQMVRTNAQLKMGGATEGMRWVTAKNEALAKGIELIDAPGLKRWITSSMMDASQCIVGVHYVLCKRPWFVGALQGFMAVFNACYAVARAIVGVAIDVAKAAGNAILYIPDALSTALKIGKWGVLAGLGYFFYKGEHKKLLARLK